MKNETGTCDHEGLGDYDIGERNRTLAVKDTSPTTNNDDNYEEGSLWSWIIVLSCFVIQAIATGIPYSFGIYLAAYREVYPNVAQATLSGIGSLASSLLVIPGIFVGRLVDRVGYTNVSLSGSVLIGVGSVLASFSSSVWQLYLTQGLVMGLGSSMAYLPSLALPAQWFTKRRALATGICSAGSGAGGLILSPLINHLITSVGIPWCLRIVGLSCAALGVLASLTLKQRIPRAPAGPLDLKVFKDTRFQLLWWGSFAWGLSFLIPFYLLPTYSASIGFNAAESSVILAVFNGCSAIGKIGLGYLADHLGQLNVMILGALLCGLFPLAIWIPATSFGPLLTFSILHGLVSGCVFSLLSVVAAKMFGLSKLATINGFLYLATGVSCLVGAPLGIGLINWIRLPGLTSYLPTMLFCGASGFLGCLLFLVVRLMVSRNLLHKF